MKTFLAWSEICSINFRLSFFFFRWSTLTEIIWVTFLWSILDARSVSMPRWRHQSKKNLSLSVKERPKLKQLLKKRMNETLLWWRNIFSLFYNFVLFTLNIFLNANYIKRMKHEKLLPEWESGVGGGWNGRGCGLQENETGIGSHAQIFTASRKKSKQTSSSKDSSPHIDFPISLPSHLFFFQLKNLFFHSLPSIFSKLSKSAQCPHSG